MRVCLGLIAAGILTAVAGPSWGESELRVMSYNMHHGEGQDGKVDLDRIAAIIKAARASIVCLQEVDRNLPRSGRVDFPTVLARKLGMKAAFEPNYAFDGGEYGNATLTSYEIAATKNLRLPGPSGAEPRGCLRMTLRVDGQRVDVLNTHLGLEPGERKDQSAAILPFIQDVPTVLAGDFNEEVDGPAIQILLSRLRDTAATGAKPRGLTFPANRPKRTIDYILVSAPLNVISFALVSTPDTAVASDHLPIVADLQLQPPAGAAARRGVYNTEDERVNEALKEGK